VAGGKGIWALIPFVLSACTSHSGDDVFAAIRDNKTRVMEEFDKEQLSGAKDKFGRSPLMAAIVEGRPELVEIMLRKGLDANSEFVDSSSGDHISMMEIATTQRPCLPKIVRSLVLHGADIEDASNFGQSTPILLAAAMANGECIREFIAAHANSRAVDRRGNGIVTNVILFENESLAVDLLNGHSEFDPLSSDASHAMYFSASKGYSKSVQALLRHGVSGCARYNGKGEFPREVAMRKKHDATAALLPICNDPTLTAQLRPIPAPPPARANAPSVPTTSP
jgi:ankyrin repeat protein